VYQQINIFLGGLQIVIKDHDNILHQHNICRDIFPCFSTPKDILLQDFFVEISFKELTQADLVSSHQKGVIYSHKRTTLYKIGTDSFQLLCLNEDETNMLWSLKLNTEFFRFDYSLSSEVMTKEALQFLLFNRFLFQHTFINNHGLIIHAAGGSIHKKGLIFPAISGIGKSTLSHLLLSSSENQLYSEERIIMRRMNDGWHLSGTPWKGSGSIVRNESTPLSALVFLRQAPTTTISKLSPSVALRRLLEVVSIPWYNQEWTKKGLVVCESLLRDIPAFELAFRPDQTAVLAVEQLAASLSS
jgi:hypothetical protein